MVPTAREIVVDFAVLPLIGALHGWLTNSIALKLLFRPSRERRFLWFRFWGVLHQRKAAIAEAMGDIVESELLRAEDIKAHLATADNLEAMANAIARAVSEHVSSRLPRALLPQLRQTIAQFLEGKLVKEIIPIIENLLQTAESEVILKGRIAPIVRERISNFDVTELENVVKRAVGREMQWIERLGFVMGLAIGFVQGFFLLILRMASLY